MATSEPKKDDFTRAMAERAIARISDTKELEGERFAKHANKHVRAKALKKNQPTRVKLPTKLAGPA